jgi:hypothetical protein
LAIVEDPMNWKLFVEPSECGHWNGFVIPTTQHLKLTWKASVCGGATVGVGRTWGKNGLASVRFTLSEFKEKGIHDVLSRQEGLASSGVKYDPIKYGKKGGWTNYPALDLSKPFVVDITEKHICITSNEKMWWHIEHHNRALIVGFNYLRFEIQPFLNTCPVEKSPVALLL